ncbi:Nucleotide-binding universal stress protein, UspA family [Raineyella antarctica]|uniref:Nucleotide-binding universal stress protein, UspA family n=1 Tax=Raineyella antarctica TaxID=1577474 RepID=A0A1G6HRK7_9ACTN|nr:universal stress protein [Raineyella antarctica]SDB96783.1 Nucleotide-binding universal stress protein, UspA family [Raineyella antarctica]
MSESSAASPVVVGYDSSDIADRAVSWASGAAERLGLPLRVVAARENEAAPVRSPEAVAAVHAAKPDLEVTGEDPIGSPAGVMVRAGEDAALVVMGSRGRGRLSSALLGTVSMTTAQHAGCPVVIIHGDDVDDRAPRRVIVGADGSSSSTAALDFALSLVGEGSTVSLVLAWSTMPEDSTDPVPAVAQAMLEQTLDGRNKEGVTIELVARPGSPRDVLVHLSAEADLLVVGRRGREGFRGLNLGSVAQHALLSAKCPVAVVTSRS